jgi:nucleotide sugar dehydrogenase
VRIGIIGMGHVGATMHDLFKEHAELTTYDITDAQPYPQDQLAACDFAVVCVGTPADGSGACDTSHVYDAVKRLPTPRVLLKSTVPPGTTEHLVEVTGKQICFSPEYVGQSTYYQPYFDGSATSVPFTIFGGDPPVRQWFIDRLLPVLGPTKVYFQCTAREAELIKYMENAYFATKVTFVKEYNGNCQALGADWHTVREGWLLDPRIEPMHTAVFPASRGFGGRCLPKDMSAIVHSATRAGYQPDFLSEALRSNDRFLSEEP